MQRSCKITKENGKLTELSLKRLRHEYASVPDGDYRNTIKPWSNSFSTRINNFFHGPVRETYAKWYGCDVTQAKRMLKWIAGPIVYTPIPGQEEPKEEPKSIAEYTQQEYIDFLEGVESHFLDCGLTMPDPQEYYWLQGQVNAP